MKDWKIATIVRKPDFIEIWDFQKKKRMMTVSQDATYIGTRPVGESSDEEIIELFVGRLGYRPLPPQPERKLC